MKQLTIILLSGVLILTACGQTLAYDPSTPQILATETNTLESLTSTPLPTRTPRERANEPTVTPHPPTPLPTIPTFTPTFDASTIVTVTPAPRAECPTADPSLTPNLDILFDQERPLVLKDQALLDFLNSGGTPQSIITTFLRELKWFRPNMITDQDVTGDKVVELILTDDRVVYIFGCKDGKFEMLLSYTDEPGWLQTISFKILDDINLNGTPEIITDEQGGHTFTSSKVSIFEWNGSEFLPLIQGNSYSDNKYFPFADTPVLANTSIRDIDGNGMLELVLESDLPIPLPSLYSYLIPWRNETDIYAWNGTHFILHRTEYSSPEFRFQAIQDADYEVTHGNLNKALSIYQDVIDNNKLKTFSHQILENEIVKSFAIDDNQPIPTPISPDATEYPRLAAYAYYRILLLDLVQENESEAGATFTTLRQKFGTDTYGRSYVEMATAFWDAYQSTHKMYHACAAAIQYAAEHPEILIPLGSNYHGSQSHTYVPADVCPFR